MEKEFRKEQNPLQNLADRLDTLQQQENNGRGVSCVKTLVFYLQAGDIEKARAVCLNEADKIVNYPKIRKIIQQELFSGVYEKDIPPHFRTSSDHIYDKRQ
ncbi:MAG: hypothetical protein HYT37_03765 [Candidatus Sungbacteria bacterium]|nr:hypothetical protein [Candidatus Sungbacteria bacterium]